MDSAFKPLPRSLGLDPGKIALGQRLFQDQRLSGDRAVACIDCHRMELGGADGVPRSQLPGRNPVSVNAPTIFNQAFNFRFSWSGKFTDMGSQIEAAMNNPDAMAASLAEARAALLEDADYRRDFATHYAEGLTEDSIRDALAVYVFSLVTPGARFDRFLQGEDELTEREEHGYQLFRDYGCISCHQGINVGGNMFQRFGVMADYFADKQTQKKADLGLFAHSDDPRDMHVFRVPSLRNVALTAPYFHDASATTLKQAVETMAHYQLGRDLTDTEAEHIVAFLETLTGEQPSDRPSGGPSGGP